MNARLTEREPKFNPNDRKENNYLYEFAVIAVMPDYTTQNPVVCRIYGTSSHKRNYACVWTYDRRNGNYVSRAGSGWAGGYGYHRPSAAAESAFRNAGIDLDEAIGGRGDSAIKEACMAVAREVCPDAVTYYLHEANP